MNGFLMFNFPFLMTQWRRRYQITFCVSIAELQSDGSRFQLCFTFIVGGDGARLLHDVKFTVTSFNQVSQMITSIIEIRNVHQVAVKYSECN